MDDRAWETGELRHAVLVATLKFFADSFEHRDGRVSQFQDELDEACKALADKLREPETCYACGQEKTP